MTTMTFTLSMPSGLAELVEWRCSREVGIAGMEATGIYWQAPWDALEQAGIDVEPCHAQHVGSCAGARPTSRTAAGWPASASSAWAGVHWWHPRCSGRCGRWSRCRRQIVKDRTRYRNRAQKVLDR